LFRNSTRVCQEPDRNVDFNRSRPANKRRDVPLIFESSDGSSPSTPHTSRKSKLVQFPPLVSTPSRKSRSVTLLVKRASQSQKPASIESFLLSPTSSVVNSHAIYMQTCCLRHHTFSRRRQASLISHTAAIFGPASLGGIGLLHLYVEHGSLKISAPLEHIRQHGRLG
jgi:hypothetical protein